MSVLPKNSQLVFSIRNYKQNMSEIFLTSSLVKISLTSFLWFSSCFFIFSKHSYLCNKKNTRWFEHMKFIFEWKKDFTCSLHSLVIYYFHSNINFICLRHRVISSIYCNKFVISSCINIFSLEITIEEMFVLTQASFSQKNAWTYGYIEPAVSRTYTRYSIYKNQVQWPVPYVSSYSTVG